MRSILVGAALLAVSAAAFAADAGDPPSRVARLNYRSGSVSFRPGSVDEWAEANLNYPLTDGDHLWTNAGAQTELHIGSMAIRMASETALSILSLDDRIAQLSLTDGSLQITVRDLDFNEAVEVDTPNAAISLLRPGSYRIDADADRGVTTVTVRSGEAELLGGGSPAPVRAGQTARISGTEQATQEVIPAVGATDFERWCDARDRREAQSQSTRYVPRQMTGYEDLDEYGTWRMVRSHGWVWVPAGLSAGWAPYRYGRWVWVEPWGWTWVDDSPWGFAPYHYGRWAHEGGGWFWVPGALGPAPVYAPALVAFVGGPTFGVGLGLGGGVAWFPLGPGEVYRPAYRVSDAYVRRMNGANIDISKVNVAKARYRNRGVEGAVTVVPGGVFVGARPVGSGMVRMDQHELSRAGVLGMTAPLAPGRESVLGATAPGRVQAPPARIAERTVVVRNTPPPAPVPFSERRQSLNANPGRPLDAAELDNLRRNVPTTRPAYRNLSGPAGGSRQASPAGGQQFPVTRPAPVDRPAQTAAPNIDRSAPRGFPVQGGNPMRPAPNADRPAQRPNPNQDRKTQKPEPTPKKQADRPAPKQDRPAQAAPPARPQTPRGAQQKEKAKPAPKPDKNTKPVEKQK